MLSYFDSSVLLSILLDEKRRSDGLALWNAASVRVSSLLLKLETITVLRRTYEHHKKTLDSGWLTKKSQEAAEYFQEVNFRIIDEDVEKVIFLKRELAQCRTLDAIHLATAWELSKIVQSSDFSLFTFDKEMADLAKSLKFQTNEVSEANGI